MIRQATYRFFDPNAIAFLCRSISFVTNDDDDDDDVAKAAPFPINRLDVR